MNAIEMIKFIGKPGYYTEILYTEIGRAHV
jgi:hypothetical protein